MSIILQGGKQISFSFDSQWCGWNERPLGVFVRRGEHEDGGGDKPPPYGLGAGYNKTENYYIYILRINTMEENKQNNEEIDARELLIELRDNGTAEKAPDLTDGSASDAAPVEAAIEEVEFATVDAPERPTLTEEEKAAAASEYDDSQIRVLEGLEAVRVRPGMYIGTTSEGGLHHLIYEIVDNSIDEALAGFCDNITVTLEADGSVSVRDDGRGVPSGINETEGLPTLEVIFTILHAGGKFGGGGYKIAGGLHGVGASVVNALSSRLEVVNSRDGYEYTMAFERGKVAEPFTRGAETDRHGLYVRFWPDDTIFETTKFKAEIVRKRLREQAFLNAGVSLTLIDERPLNDRGDKNERTEENFCYEGGIREFVEYIRENKKADAVHEDVIYVSGAKGTSIAEVALQYNTDYSEAIVSFANNMHTVEGGMHEEGFKRALTDSFNDYGRKKGIFKGDDKLTGEDTREGLVAVISVKLENAQFESQTKAKLGNSEVRRLVYSIVRERLAEYLEENPRTARAIIDKAMAASRAREAARKAREASRKSLMKGSTLPGKLADCHEKNVDVTEIFLVEGDSAGGSAKGGRNSTFQAILPLRGKVLDVEKSRLDKVYGNPSLLPIIQALGCGIGEDFDIEKLRYGKIIIMADADVDGSHIRILLLTFFFRHMRRLIEDGHVFLAQPPLYKVTKGKQIRYAFSDEERDAAIAELGSSGVEAERYKGLGEMDSIQLRETTMDPKKRTLLKVTIEDAILCDEIFSVLMGDKVEPRREFIEKNAKYAENLDI